MIPNFNPNKWDREKIIEYVVGDAPLDDQQLAFLDYFVKLQDNQNKLIDFLEQRSQYQDELLSNWKMDDCNYQSGKRYAYKEILDFIKGGKDE